MKTNNLINLRYLFAASVLFFTAAYADASQCSEEPAELPRSEIFPPEDGRLLVLQGKILNGRYYAPKNVFSCQADDYGAGSYTAQDVLLKEVASVAFYNHKGDFKKAEIILLPGLEKKIFDKDELNDIFKSIGIGILKDVDKAQGIEILNEEMIADNMLFVAVSIRKTSTLRASNGEYMSSTRGYLLFQNKDKVAMLSNQEVTLPRTKHDPKKHIESLKKSILDFSTTFEFGPIPLSEETEEDNIPS